MYIAQYLISCLSFHGNEDYSCREFKLGHCLCLCRLQFSFYVHFVGAEWYNDANYIVNRLDPRSQ